MPEALSTFLLTPPYKNKEYLKHICDKLKLSNEGFAEPLRERIIKHVGNNKKLDNKVREIARKLKKKKHSMPLTPTVHVLRGSSPTRVRLRANSTATSTPSLSRTDLFETEDELERSIIEKLDEAEEMHDKLVRLKGNKNFPGGDIEGIVDDDGDDDDDDDDDLDDDDSDVDGDDEDDDEAKGDGVDVVASDSAGDDASHSKDDGDRNSAISSQTTTGKEVNDSSKIKILESLLEKAMSVVKAKDKQIKTQERHIESLETSIAQVVSATNQLMAKHGDEYEGIKASLLQLKDQTTDTGKKLDETVLQIRQAETKISTDIRDINRAIQKMNYSAQSTSATSSATSSATFSATSSATSAAMGASQNISAPPLNNNANLEQRLRNVANANAAPGTTTAAPAAHAAPSTTAAKDTPKSILIIGDSNTRDLDPKLLHEEKRVIIERKATLIKAINEIHTIPDPGDVSDVVLLLGLNDLRPDNVTVLDVIHKVDTAGQAYSRKFPNAKIHVGGVAPANDKCIDFNEQLKVMTDEKQVPFISVDPMFDRDSLVGNRRPNLSDLRTNMVKKNDVHYTSAGVATFAKEIKRSLYGYKRKSNPRHFIHRNADPRPFPQFANGSKTMQHNAGLSDARGAIASFLNMAMAQLGSL